MSDPSLGTPFSDNGTEPWTRREILQQPATLQATQAVLRQRSVALDSFLQPLLGKADLRIILTGAGTSSFIGDCLAPWLESQTGRRVEAIATTDIVSAPSLYLRPEAPTLLVSFGRSGDSPESLAAIDRVDQLVRDAHHLIITCNAEGELARRERPNGFVLLLPEATHDRGFAMTSSFTAMTYAALSIFTGIDQMDARIGPIADAVADVLVRGDGPARALAQKRFERVVYLGSGPFKGLAREGALKLMELTDGALVTAFDSPMGFRHGPKTIVNAKTLVMVFVSNDPITRAYDLDLVEELRTDGKAGAVFTISTRADGPDVIPVAHLDGAADIDLLFPYIIPAQLYALHASIDLKLAPDKPNASGTVNRVVQGVRLHALSA